MLAMHHASTVDFGQVQSVKVALPVLVYASERAASPK